MPPSACFQRSNNALPLIDYLLNSYWLAGQFICKLPLGMDLRRIQIVDALRGFALFGILFVNLPYFASTYFPGAGVKDPQSLSWVDTGAEFLTGFLFESKFYVLFALLFGYSFVLQQQAAERSGAQFVPRMLRRSLGLFVIGAIHAIYFWFADILTLYAVLSLVLLACRNIRPRTAVIAAGVLLALVTTFWLVLSYVLLFVNPNLFGVDVAAGTAEAIHAGSAFGGSFGDAVHQRIAELKVFAPLVYTIQGPIAMAMLFLGYAAAKADVLGSLEQHRALFVKLIRVGLPVGLMCAAVYAYSVVWASPPAPIVYIALALTATGAPLLMGAYASIFTLTAMKESGEFLIDLFAPVGRMALTNYVLQSVILGVIFYGYGFGMINSVRPHEVFLMAFAVFAVQVAISHLWMERFQYGPLEWVLRAITNLEFPPLRNRDRDLATAS